MAEIIKKNIFSFLFVFLIFVVDRVSKVLIVRKSESLGEFNMSINSYLNLNLIWNDGIAFGLFSSSQKTFYNSITLLIILVIFLIIWFMIRAKSIEKLGFSMILGGSLGNVFDRIIYSSVPDFIDIYYNNFHWFIFNVADIFISLGVILLIFLEIFTKKKQ